jgi:hypothetical protein
LYGNRGEPRESNGYSDRRSNQYDQPSSRSGAANLPPLRDERCYFCARPGHRQRDCLTRARYFKNSMDNGTPLETRAQVQRRMPGVRPSNNEGSAAQQRSFTGHGGKNEEKGKSLWVSQLEARNSKNGVRSPLRGRRRN